MTRPEAPWWATVLVGFMSAGSVHAAQQLSDWPSVPVMSRMLADSWAGTVVNITNATADSAGGRDSSMAWRRWTLEVTVQSTLYGSDLTGRARTVTYAPDWDAALGRVPFQWFVERPHAGMRVFIPLEGPASAPRARVMLECGQGQLCADGASLQFLRTSQRLSPQKRASELARAMCEAAYGGGKGQGLLGIYEYEWALAYQESGKSLDGSRRVVDQYWPAILEAEVGPLTVWAGGMVGTDRRRELVRSLLVVHDSLTADWQQRAAKQDTSIRIDPRFDEMTPQKEEAIASSLALMYLRSVLEYLSNPALIQYEEPLFFERACCSPNGDAVDVARAFANGH